MAAIPPEDVPYVGYIEFPVGECTNCKKKTSDLYSRTIDGSKYCLPCLKLGAGLRDLEAAGMGSWISEATKEEARKNGLY